MIEKIVDQIKGWYKSPIGKCGVGHNIGHSVGWVEQSETQQLIGVGLGVSHLLHMQRLDQF